MLCPSMDKPLREIHLVYRIYHRVPANMQMDHDGADFPSILQRFESSRVKSYLQLIVENE